MTDLIIHPYRDCRDRQVYVADRPISFTDWLELAEKLDTELIDGVMIEIMAAQYPHEWIFAWFLSILRPYVTRRKLGAILGSRSAVKIHEYRGRIPDLLFIRAENSIIIQDDAIYGVPDLVIEIVSKNDFPADLIPLEADYRSLGVPEIVFFDPKKKRVRYLRKNGDDYDETILKTGKLEFSCIPGFWIETEWIFADNKPEEFTITRDLIEAVEREEKE